MRFLFGSVGTGVRRWLLLCGCVCASLSFGAMSCSGQNIVQGSKTYFESLQPGPDRLIPADVNGDGLTDMIAYRDGGNVNFCVFLSNGATFQPSRVDQNGNPYWTDYGEGAPHSWEQLYAMDANGDGKVDLVQSWGAGGSTKLLIYLSNGKSFDKQTWYDTQEGYAQALYPMDVNGDGKVDMVQKWDAGNLNLMVYLSTGTSFNKQSWYSTGEGAPHNWEDLYPMDVNGDGKVDMVQSWGAGGSTKFMIYLSNGKSFDKQTWYDTQEGYAQGLYPMDVNGDGRVDMVQKWDSGQLNLLVYLSTGKSFNKQSWYSTGEGAPHSWESLYPMDVDGDGRVDLVQSWGASNLELMAYLSTGISFQKQVWYDTKWNDGGNQPTKLLPMRVDWDKKTDLVLVKNNGGNTVSYVLPFMFRY